MRYSQPQPSRMLHRASPRRVSLSMPMQAALAALLSERAMLLAEVSDIERQIHALKSMNEADAGVRGTRPDISVVPPFRSEWQQ